MTIDIEYLKKYNIQDRQTDQPTDGQTDRQTNRQTESNYTFLPVCIGTL